MNDFDISLSQFIAAAQAIVNKDYAEHLQNLTPEVLVNVGGVKYVKIARTNADTGQAGSVHCFVEKSTGNILKAASWKTPAKGVRGSIYAEDHGASAMTPYGAVYHR